MLPRHYCNKFSLVFVSLKRRSGYTPNINIYTRFHLSRSRRHNTESVRLNGFQKGLSTKGTDQMFADVFSCKAKAVNFFRQPFPYDDDENAFLTNPDAARRGIWLYQSCVLVFFAKQIAVWFYLKSLIYHNRKFSLMIIRMASSVSVQFSNGGEKRPATFTLFILMLVVPLINLLTDPAKLSLLQLDILEENFSLKFKKLYITIKSV